MWTLVMAVSTLVAQPAAPQPTAVDLHVKDARVGSVTGADIAIDAQGTGRFDTKLGVTDADGLVRLVLRFHADDTLAAVETPSGQVPVTRSRQFVVRVTKSGYLSRIHHFKWDQRDTLLQGLSLTLRREEDLKDADYLITDPGRSAVALLFRPQTMKRPLVLAKATGEKEVARYKEVAPRVRVMPWPELTEALYRDVETGEEVPELYQQHMDYIFAPAKSQPAAETEQPRGAPAAAAPAPAAPLGNVAPEAYTPQGSPPTGIGGTYPQGTYPQGIAPVEGMAGGYPQGVPVENYGSYQQTVVPARGMAGGYVMPGPSYQPVAAPPNCQRPTGSWWWPFRPRTQAFYGGGGAPAPVSPPGRWVPQFPGY